MSKVLESLKCEITKSRGLGYFGKYIESITQFSRIIASIQSQIELISDKNLTAEWNRLLGQIRSQRDQMQCMRDVMQGNFDTQNVKKQSRESKEPPEREIPAKIKHHISSYEDPSESKVNYPFGKIPFRKGVAHEDDEIYNKKEKEIRIKQKNQVQQEKIDKEQKERQQREFQERQAEIWPKKKPLAQKKISGGPNKNNFNIKEGNNSGVNAKNKNRQYPKDWNVNAKIPGKENGEEKKSFLKFCYPDGQGPDANLIEMLERQVVDFCPTITFDDIAELQKAKDVLEEAVLLPLAMPHLFKGIRRPWKGVLLFGPPGTGKTLLAKAIASTGKTTFFNVTASSLASKWKGESEKLVRLLFEMAKFYAPTTIFIDEIDALAGTRGEKQDESSRKVKTELMTRIDGASSGNDDNVMMVVVGATNRPWDLDEAIRRRLQKRIYIPLPTEIGRRELIKIQLKDQKIEAVDIEELVAKTDGYSGADLANLCRQAAYMPMRRKLKKEGGLGKKLTDGKWMSDFEKEVNIPLCMDDFLEALKNVKPSVGKGDLANYEKWMKEFGEQGTN